MQKNISTKEWNVPKALFGVFFFCLIFLFLVYVYISISPKVLGIDIQKFALTRNKYYTVLKAKRGTIYDNSNNTLALNVYSYTVIAYLSPTRTVNPEKPAHVVDIAYTAKALAPILNMTEADLTNLLSLGKEGRYQVELGPGGRNITELKKEEIEKLNLPGIDFVESSKRFYPNGDFASYIIGYAKTNERETENGIEKIIDGELGIEYKYNDMLKGTDGSLSYQQDANGYQIPETKEERVDALDGYDIHLTIDSGIQRFIEEVMDEAESKYKYEWLQIHVMDAKTGRIVGSASSPSFDPNIRNLTNYENNLTSILIEPGSVMKTMTYLCAMEKGTYDGTKTYKSGRITVGDTYIEDWNNRGWGVIDYDYGYVQSSNVGITNMLLIDKFIDADDLKECLTKFGFGSPTGIELSEVAGKIDFYYPVEIATAGFGQGIYVTPIQILQAYSIISNNGKMLKPHIIDKIVDPNENKIVYQSNVDESETLISMDTVEKIKSLMYDVVNSKGGSGGGYSALSYGVDLIGKTGTAEIFENGRYLSHQYIRSFAGMFPKENPRYIIYAAVKKVSPDANTVLTTSVKKIVSNIAKYFNIYDNSKETAIKSYNVSNYLNRDTAFVSNELKTLGIVPVLIGDGNYIINQLPKANTTVLAGEKIFLMTNSSNYTMPNMKGWSRKDVMTYLDAIGANYVIEGQGFVTKQSLSASSKIDTMEQIVITLNDKY